MPHTAVVAYRSGRSSWLLFLDARFAREWILIPEYRFRHISGTLTHRRFFFLSLREIGCTLVSSLVVTDSRNSIPSAVSRWYERAFPKRWFFYFQTHWYSACTNIVVSKHFMNSVVFISDGTVTRPFAKISSCSPSLSAFISDLDVLGQALQNSFCTFVQPFLELLHTIFWHASSDYGIVLHTSFSFRRFSIEKKKFRSLTE